MIEMEISVLIEKGLEGCPRGTWFKNIAKQVLTILNMEPATEVSLVITNQEKITELNRAYLGKDEPTDVIAFSMLPTGETFVTPPDSILHLGEVIVSYPQAVLQAKGRRHPVKKELAILIVHGILHLLGYEDETPEQKMKMDAKAAKILGIINVVA